MLGLDDTSLLLKMMRMLEHRGPDDQGMFNDASIGLGFRGIKIAGPMSSSQPICNEDGSICIVCDGRIYNYADLRKELESKGHRFSTPSDVETIIHEYEENGEFCVKKLRGMFAFALWDSNRKALFLARDRLGTKPLYYTHTEKVLLFASEMKAILQYPQIKREIDYKSLYNFLTFRFNSRSTTILQGINKLPPAHTLTAKRDGGIIVSRYWDLKMQPAIDSDAYFIDELHDVITRCVQAQVMGEVPVGAYLSGGLDSSTIVGIMSESNEEPIETFSTGFAERECSELNYARLVAQKFETNHHEIIVDEKSTQILPRVIWHFDEPIADPAAIPTYLMSDLVRKHCRVVFSGEGGDEQFGGYEHWKIMDIGERYLKKVPKYLRKSLIPVTRAAPKGIVNSLFRYASSLGEEGIRRFSGYIASLDNTAKSYLTIVSIFEEREMEELCAKWAVSERKNLKILNNLHKVFKEANSPNLLGKLQLLEIQTALPESHIMKNDKMSLAHGVEVRFPFCDHILAEFCATLPRNLKIRGLTDKYALRKAMKGILPGEVKTRKKARFFVPIDSWMLGEFGEIAQQILNGLGKRGYLKDGYINKIFDNFKKSPLYYSRQIWSLLTFELWHKIYIDRDDTSRPPEIIDDFI